MSSHPCNEPAVGLSAEELSVTRERMELYDSLGPDEAELVQEYGLAPAMYAARQFYGRWDEARRWLEEHRKALQVARWENIPNNRP